MKKIISICLFLLVVGYSCKSTSKQSSELSQIPSPSPFNSWIDVSCDAYCSVKYDARSQENTKITQYIACIGDKETCTQYVTDKSSTIKTYESIATLSRDATGFYIGNIYKSDSGASCIYLIGLQGKNNFVIKGFSMPGQECKNP